MSKMKMTPDEYVENLKFCAGFRRLEPDLEDYVGRRVITLKGHPHEYSVGVVERVETMAITGTRMALVVTDEGGRFFAQACHMRVLE